MIGRGATEADLAEDALRLACKLGVEAGDAGADALLGCLQVPVGGQELLHVRQNAVLRDPALAGVALQQLACYQLRKRPAQ